MLNLILDIKPSHSQHVYLYKSSIDFPMQTMKAIFHKQLKDSLYLLKNSQNIN